MRKVVQVIRQSHDPDKHVANSETLIYNVDIATLSEPLQGIFTNQDFPEYDIHTDWFDQYRDAKDYGTCDILNNMKCTSEDQELEYLDMIRSELYDAHNRKVYTDDEYVGLVKFSGLIYHC